MIKMKICLLSVVLTAFLINQCESTPRSLFVAPFLAAHAASQGFSKRFGGFGFLTGDSYGHMPLIVNVPIRVDPDYQRPEDRNKPVTAHKQQVKPLTPAQDDSKDYSDVFDVVFRDDKVGGKGEAKPAVKPVARPLPASASGPGSEVPREPTPPPKGNNWPELNFDDVKVSSEITNFGLKFIQHLGNNNAVFSPLSLTLCLALLQQGASGVTENEISTVLNTTPQEAARSYKRFTTAMRNRMSKNTLDVATNLFTSQVYVVNNNFKRTALENFGSDITPINFASPEAAAAKMDAWVQKRTRNNIENLISPNSIARESQMIFANAVYFKGFWQTKFDRKSTIPRDFHLSTGKTKKAQFMRIIGDYRTGFDGQIQSQVVVIPFQADQYSLMIILPSQVANLNTVLSNLGATRLLNYLKLPTKEVKLQVPKFSVRGDTDLKKALQTMGVSSLFGPESELNGIGVYGLSPKISAAVHSAVLTIDEDGGTAAAASAFAAVPLTNDDKTVQFIADRPFLGILWDNALAIPLFMVRIEDPSII